MNFRIGYGWDSHEFKPGLPLKIGGVKLPHDRGLAGHSDGDVLLHALADALLGALAAGDIGVHFPSADPKWKNADSAIFVGEAVQRVRRAGYRVVNTDSTLILKEPKIAPHAARIQGRIAELLGISPDAVGVKAKTPEGMGMDNAAMAHVTVLLVQPGPGKKGRQAMAQAAQPEEVNQVVEKLLKSAEPELAEVGPPAKKPRRRGWRRKN